MDSSGAAGARDAASDRRGDVTGDEAVRLRIGFGSILRTERAALGWDQRELARRAGVGLRTVAGLECGDRRPTTGMTWRLARAMRADRTLRERVVLDERLRRGARESLREFARKPRRAREEMREQVRAEAGEDLPVAVGDLNLGLLIAQELTVDWVEGQAGDGQVRQTPL